MRKFRTWLIAQLEKLLLMPDYFRALAKEWLNILFGETLVGIAFLIWWALGAPTNHALVVVFVIAMFVAGYYAWRVDHIRLIPQFELVSLHTPHTPTNAPNIQRRFVQLLVRSTTDGAVEECRGNLVKVEKWSAFNNAWQPTSLDEPIDLLWSNINVHSTTLESGLDRRVNLFFIETNRWLLLPSEVPVPLRAVITYAPKDIFKFHIRITGKECPTQYAFIKATFGQNWDDITVEEIKNGD